MSHLKFKALISASVVAIAALTACEDSTSTVGSSLVTDQTEIVVDSSFTVSGISHTNAVVQSRTLTQLLGNLDAREYGSITADFVCQFMPAMNIDTEGVTVDDIDSLKLLMFMTPGDFTGDSLAPMGLEVYQLQRQLPSPIYSDFNPDGYYDPSAVIGSTIYTANAMHSDSIAALGFRSISVDLPVELGKTLFSEYAARPETFATPESFCRFFPGLFVTNSFGSGIVVNINESRLNLYYRKHDKVQVSDNVTKDTVYNVVRTYMAVTPEVITNNNITLDMSPAIDAMVDAGDAVIVAPTGTEVEIIFPTEDIIAAYRKGNPSLAVINSLTLSIPAEEIENTYGINPPDRLLMVLSTEKDKFFADNKITDSKTSFMLTYSAAAEAYVLSDLREYIITMMEKESITADDCRFTLTPVNVETETTSSSYYYEGTTYVTSISPYVTKPAMAKLDLGKAKIKLTFSRQSAD